MDLAHNKITRLEIDLHLFTNQMVGKTHREASIGKPHHGKWICTALPSIYFQNDEFYNQGK